MKLKKLPIGISTLKDILQEDCIYVDKMALVHSPQLNPIEQLWKFMKYYWIELDAYKSVKKMKNYVEKVIIGYGEEYEIKFC